MKEKVNSDKYTWKKKKEEKFDMTIWEAAIIERHKSGKVNHGCVWKKTHTDCENSPQKKGTDQTVMTFFL